MSRRRIGQGLLGPLALLSLLATAGCSTSEGDAICGAESRHCTRRVGEQTRIELRSGLELSESYATPAGRIETAFDPGASAPPPPSEEDYDRYALPTSRPEARS
ncbi:MAG: hypothetical protein OEY14_00585, partial [Myxococcales bacterium]|nr:hypothetical protein [Myxococcales bacterium]